MRTYSKQLSTHRFNPPHFLLMHEDLLGYLLGALEPAEMHRVSEWIKSDPEAQRLLAEIERSLRPLEDGFRAVEPPSDDLLARTLAAIPEGTPPNEDESPSDGMLNEAFAAPSAMPGSPARVTLADIDLSREPSGVTSRWNWMDSVGSLLSVAVLLALLLPTLAAGRFQSRKVACQNQLRELGTALMQYVYRDHQGRLPQIAQSGPQAFAGVYSIRLADAGLLPDGGVRWCPSADMPILNAKSSGVDSDVSTVSSASLSLDCLPKISELKSLDVNDLQWVQRYAGGHYTYTLGVLGDQGYASPRYEARTAFAVMSDAPIGPADQSDASVRFSHGDQGMNVLFEDGAVRFIRASALGSMPDHPLLNHDGDSEAGVNIDDASLAPSWRPPFSGALQR